MLGSPHPGSQSLQVSNICPAHRQGMPKSGPHAGTCDKDIQHDAAKSCWRMAAMLIPAKATELLGLDMRKHVEKV